MIRGRQESLSGRLVDIGEGGAFLATNQVLALDPPVRLHFEFSGQLCEAVGWVVRSMPHAAGQGTAVEFHRVNDEFLTYIRRLVEVEEMKRVDLLAGVQKLVIEIG